MAQEFKLPDLGEGLTEATLVDWKVKEGDVVAKDQVLAEVETDKATAPLPSPVAGKIAKLHFKPGDKVKIGATLATLDAPEAKSAPAPAAPVAKLATSTPVAAAPTAKPASPAMTTPPPMEPMHPGRPVLAAPATRRLAREQGIDIRNVRGTGPGGRITTEDVKALGGAGRWSGGGANGQPVSHPQRPALPDFTIWGEVERQKATTIRKRIAQRMAVASQTVAAVTHFDEADVTALEESRSQAQAMAQEKGIRLTLLPYVVKAVATALLRHPIFNASWDDDAEEVVFKKYVNIGIAVDSPQGLLVPVVKGADKKRVVEIAKDIAALADKAKQGKLAPDDMRGGTFTITNIGAIGGTSFTPIVNWPEVAILGLARSQERPMLKDGVLVNRKKMPLCLTFDHRVTDGAQAARFMNDLRVLIENPLMVLLES